MSIFTKLESSSAAQATLKAGIEKLVPNMTIDDVLFEPCGYSMNGITKGVGFVLTLYNYPENRYLHLAETPFLESREISFPYTLASQ